MLIDLTIKEHHSYQVVEIKLFVLSDIGHTIASINDLLLLLLFAYSCIFSCAFQGCEIGLNMFYFPICINNSKWQEHVIWNVRMCFKSPPLCYRASATIEMGPLTDAHKWKIGWIQACTDMMFHNTYADEGL